MVDWHLTSWKNVVGFCCGRKTHIYIHMLLNHHSYIKDIHNHHSYIKDKWTATFTNWGGESSRVGHGCKLFYLVASSRYENKIQSWIQFTKSLKFKRTRFRACNQFKTCIIYSVVDQYETSLKKLKALFN